MQKLSAAERKKLKNQQRTAAKKQAKESEATAAAATAATAGAGAGAGAGAAAGAAAAPEDDDPNGDKLVNVDAIEVGTALPSSPHHRYTTRHHSWS